MNERIMQFRVGVMILAAILIAAILVLLFKGSSLMQGTYPIYIKFSEAPGVSRDTPVRMDGIRIGRVQEVQFANRERGVIVTAEIDRNRTLYSDDQCRATYSLLMGDAALEFVRVADVAGNPVPIEPGTTLQGQSPRTSRARWPVCSDRQPRPWRPSTRPATTLTAWPTASTTWWRRMKSGSAT